VSASVGNERALVPLPAPDRSDTPSDASGPAGPSRVGRPAKERPGEAALWFDQDILQQWQQDELRWMAHTETLERQLRRRTMALGCVLAGVAGLATGIGAFTVLAPERHVAEVVLPLPPAAPPAAPAAAEKQAVIVGEEPRAGEIAAVEPTMIEEPEPPQAVPELQQPELATPRSAPELLPRAENVPSPAAPALPAPPPSMAAADEWPTADLQAPRPAGAALRSTLASIKQRLSQPDPAHAPTMIAPVPAASEAAAASLAMLAAPEPTDILPTALEAAEPSGSEAGRPAATPAAKALVASSGSPSGAVSAGPGEPRPALADEGGSIVVSEYVNLRAKPDHAGQVLAVIEPGSKVQDTTRRSGGWLEVRSESGLSGWVFGRFLSPAEPTAE
jgi:hypothetical protein